VAVEERPLPKIEHPDDCLIKVTTAAICGSDLHMYQGRTAAKGGLCFGHENMGVVIKAGEGVSLLKEGDRVVMPFNVAVRVLICLHV
jgi:threonine dehydrogenase-like Zn-dependent dehydrogenase